jgi:hypothetical protein
MLMMLTIANQKPMSLEAATPARPTIRNAAVSHTRTLVRMWVRQKVLMADTTCQWEAGGVGVRVGGVRSALGNAFRLPRRWATHQAQGDVSIVDESNVVGPAKALGQGGGAAEHLGEV